jgi:hypothetical protein
MMSMEQAIFGAGSAWSTKTQGEYNDPLSNWRGSSRVLSASPLLAADTDNPTNPPTGANAAGGDTSSGAKEQSSAPPGSPAESDLSTKSSEGASGDTSGGAKEQSSAPPGSTAATGQPNSSSDTTNSPSGTMKPSQP